MGTAAALALLALLVIVFGQLIVTRVPEAGLKLLVGTLLLLFGLRWLHKAVLRSGGVVEMHDEERAYQQTVGELQGEPPGNDWVGFVLALKGVFLEGLAVVFIGIAVGGTGPNLPVAVVGGRVSLVVVALAGVTAGKRPAPGPRKTRKCTGRK